MREELMVKCFVEKQPKRCRRSDIKRHRAEATIFLRCRGQHHSSRSPVEVNQAGAEELLEWKAGT
jgi:hypothetical protein